MRQKFKHLGLFEGIGGFSLAARWMGWETVAWVEWNEFNKKLLKVRFPEAKGYGDITKTDFTVYANRINIITGGFPCQPYSQAGKRKGKEDERHLWPQMLRAVREVSPRWVLGENVRGLTTWDGGLVFNEVQSDLEAEGYKVLPILLPSAGIGGGMRGTEYGLLPTPTRTDFIRTRFKMEQTLRSSFNSTINSLNYWLNKERGIYQTPEVTEYLMGFPSDWTKIDWQD